MLISIRGFSVQEDLCYARISLLITGRTSFSSQHEFPDDIRSVLICLIWSSRASFTDFRIQLME